MVIKIKPEFKKVLLQDPTIFKMAADSSSNHIIITDTEGIILYANQAAADITGYKISEMLGKTPRLWGGLMSKSFYKQMWKIVKIEKKSFIGEIRNKRKNGERYFAKIKISPILDYRKHLCGFVANEEDITREKEFDQIKTAFVNTAAHQLKTPVSIIRWYAELLQIYDMSNLTPVQKKYVSGIYEADLRLNEWMA